MTRLRYVPSEQSLTTGASTPLPSAGSVACKVTPLPDAPPDLNARYPYGADVSSRDTFISCFPLNVQFYTILY